MVLMLEGHARAVNDVVFSPDGRRIAAASSDRSVKLWEAAPEAALAAVRDETAAAVRSRNGGAASGQIRESRP